MDGRVLGQDGDAALPFQLVRIHDALDDGLVGAEGAGLAEHGVDEGGLAVVDVGDDGDIADGAGHGGAVLSSWLGFFSGLGGGPPPPSRRGRASAKSCNGIGLGPIPRPKNVLRKDLHAKISFHWT